MSIGPWSVICIGEKGVGVWRKEGRCWSVERRRKVLECGEKEEGVGVWRKEGRCWSVEKRRKVFE